MENNHRYFELRKASIITIICNSILTVAKIAIGFASGSIAVISDGIHTFSDVFTTVMVIIGLKFSSKAADAEHPYGHQRIESLVSLFLAFVLALTALYLGYQGVLKLIDRQQLEPSWLALIITVASIAIKEWMFQYSMKKAKEFDSSSMRADAWHHRSDAVSSVAVLIGVVGIFFGLWILEPIATIFVCLIILKAVYDIGKLAISQLIDHSATEELCGEIRSLVESVAGVECIDLLKTRISNNLIFVELEISVRAELSVSEGHEIAENVHEALETVYSAIEHCVVHVNPLAG